jgi:ribosome-associated heat shock protein Hsp15
MDEISLRKNQLNLQLKVLDIPSQRVGAKWVGIYREDITDPAELKHFELMQASREHYRKKGEGRPTKKDRRDLEDYLDESE